MGDHRGGADAPITKNFQVEYPAMNHSQRLQSAPQDPSPSDRRLPAPRDQMINEIMAAFAAIPQDSPMMDVLAHQL